MRRAGCINKVDDGGQGGGFTRTGFTLIELIIVIVLVAILGSIGSMLLQQNIKAYLSAKNITPIVYNNHIAAVVVMRELKNAKSIGGTIEKTLIYTNQKGLTLHVTVSGGNLTRNIVASGSPSGGSPQLICENVGDVTFNYYDQSFGSVNPTGNVRYITMQIMSTSGNFTSTLLTGTTLRTMLP